MTAITRPATDQYRYLARTPINPSTEVFEDALRRITKPLDKLQASRVSILDHGQEVGWAYAMVRVVATEDEMRQVRHGWRARAVFAQSRP